MKVSQLLPDKFAIGLSMLCAIHCLALPIILVLLPSLGSLPLQDEAYHLWMLVAVIPISLYALTLGCKKHKKYQIFIWGALGLLLMVLAVLCGHELAGEYGEKILTLLGATFVSFAHLQNFRRCQKNVTCKH
ncbi:MerC domain-containing protein [Colwellia sp. E2M01]|uniref:MerC domain-containing protein n=1 Tax=Colwellia sp. E2M01 TaxID=2841561 RepID=UPI001C088CA8|nr:MerC domain-containing protein [Colwellia sp. E2M01]MBU2869077.1 MerC domain-containing protein [Colwellia sp. E2M01]